MDAKIAKIIDKLLEHPEGSKVFAAMDDERKEACIHCKKVWYSIHYQNGVCHSCQQQDRPGRAVLLGQERRIRQFKIYCLLFVVLIITYIALEVTP